MCHELVVFGSLFFAGMLQFMLVLTIFAGSSPEIDLPWAREYGTLPSKTTHMGLSRSAHREKAADVCSFTEIG